MTDTRMVVTPRMHAKRMPSERVVTREAVTYAVGGVGTASAPHIQDSQVELLFGYDSTSYCTS